LSSNPSIAKKKKKKERKKLNDMLDVTTSTTLKGEEKSVSLNGVVGESLRSR
jgi:hypothetical protein